MKPLRSEKVARTLIDRIRLDWYKDGLLPSQRRLAGEFHVAKSTVQSALDSLQRDGWIVCAPKRRARVVRRHEAFVRKLSAFVQSSGFREPRMHGSFVRQDAPGTPGGIIDLSAFCNEHWDGHLGIELEQTAMRRAFERYRSGRTKLFQTTGVESLREKICGLLERFEIHAKPSEIVILPRRLEAFRLFSEILIGPGTTLWYPEISTARYYGIASRHTRRRRLLPVDDLGRTDFSAFLQSQSTQVLMLEPDHPKPFALSMPEPLRDELVAHALRTNTFLFEDGYCALLYEDCGRPLMARDKTKEAVVYMGSIPNWLTVPGCLTWLVANEGLVRLMRASIRRDYTVPELFGQLVAEELLSDDLFPELLGRFRVFHRERLAEVDRLLRRYLPPGAEWTLPGSFGCIWVRIPGLVLRRLHRERTGVDFQPGWFYGEAKSRHLLLRYTLPIERLEEGLKRLARSIRGLLQRG